MNRIIKYTVLSSVATVLLWAIAVIGYGMFSASSLTAIDRSKQISRTAQLETEIRELEELKRLVDFYDPNDYAEYASDVPYVGVAIEPPIYVCVTHGESDGTVNIMGTDYCVECFRDVLVRTGVEVVKLKEIKCKE